MGKITKVSSSIYNLLGKQEPVRCIRVITMQYLFDGTDRFTPMLIDSLLEGNGLRFRNYLKWAENSGYNDWLGISAPSFMQTVRLDSSTLVDAFKPVMEADPDLDMHERYEYKDTDITIRYPNPKYVIDPETGEYPPDQPQYLFKDITFSWEYYSRAEINLSRWALSPYMVDQFAPIILDMCFGRTLKDLKLTAEDVMDGDTNYSAGQIKIGDKYYLRFGDLTTYNGQETEPGLASDLSDTATWDRIVGDIDVTVLATKPGGTYFIGVIFWVSRNTKKAIYESYEDETGKVIYISSDENGTLNRIGYEEAVASSPDDPYEDWTGISNCTWSDIQNMGPLWTLQSESLNSFKVAYIWTLPTGIDSIDKLIPAPITIDDDYWGSWFPLRDDNRAIEPNRYPEAWEWGKKVGRKLYNDSGKIAELIDQINQNPQVGDIDYAYLEVGIPINVKQKYVCRYMFEFWRNMFDRVGAQTEGEVLLDCEYPRGENHNGSGRTYIWANLPESAIDAMTPHYNDVPSYPVYDSEDRAVWHKWYGVEQVADGSGLVYHVKNGIVLPIDPAQDYKVTSGGTINIATSGSFNRHISIDFGGILYQSGVGVLDNNHDSGDCWANITTDHFLSLSLGETFSGVGSSTPNWGHWGGLVQVTVNWISYFRQIDATHWEIIRVSFMNQKNIIKNGVGDYNYGVQEFNKPEEDYQFSGVLIPLSYNTMKSISLLDATDCVQFASSLRFNCYVVKKKKWYQSGFFGAIIKIAGIVISVVVAIVASPAGSAAVGSGLAGLMGVTSAIGTAIINAVANAVIAVVVTSVVSPVLKDLLGDVIGGILTAIVTIAVTWGINYGITNGFDLSSLSNEFMKIDNILAIAKSVGNVYMEVLQGDMQDLQNDIQNFQNRYNEASDELASATEANLSGFGMNQYWQQLYYQNNALNSVIESRDRFLDRTLMLADDAIDIQLQWIEDLPRMTIRDNPTSDIVS